MIHIFIAWIIIIGVEIFRNWCIVEVDGKRPTYWWSNTIRISVGFIFWTIVPLVIKIGYWNWLVMPLMMVLTFWWMFDYGLTLSRNWSRKLMKTGDPIVFYYLNPKGSWLDQLQCKYPHPYPWFWFKLFLMGAGILLYFNGLDFVWEVPQ